MQPHVCSGVKRMVLFLQTSHVFFRYTNEKRRKWCCVFIFLSLKKISVCRLKLFSFFVF